MAEIDQKLGDGGMGRGISEESGVDNIVALMNAVVDDLTELRTQFVALLAKLDADGGVTDTDYASTLTPSALTLTKGS